MPPFTTDTIYYDPLTSTTSTSTTSPVIYTSTSGPTIFRYDNTEEKIKEYYDNTEEKMKEYCDKVDQHVDNLEEDIEFLNNKRKMNEEHIERLIDQNIQKDTKIKELEDSITFLKGYTGHLEGLIHVLEAKINE